MGPRRGFHPDPLVGVLARQVSWADAREVRCVNRVPGQPRPPVTWSSRHVSSASHAPGHLVQPSRVPVLAWPRLRHVSRVPRHAEAFSGERLVRGGTAPQPASAGGFSKGVDAVWQGKAATTSQQGVSTEMAPSGASSAGTSAGRHLSGTGRRLNGRSPHSTCRRSSSSRRVARCVPGPTAPMTRQRSGRRDWPPGR